MQNNQLHSKNITSSESVDTTLRSTVGAACAALAFDKQSITAALQELHQSPNLLAIGTQDIEEVLRQDRLEYEEELRYEADPQAKPRRQTEEQHLGELATVHYLPPPQEQAPVALPHESLVG